MPLSTRPVFFVCALQHRIVSGLRNLCRKAWAAPADRVRQAMFWVFWLSIVIFPFGPSEREIMPSLCLLLLLRYYYLDWQGSTLRRFSAKSLLVLLGLGVLAGVLGSHSVWDSALHVLRHINKGYVLLLVAMECVRSLKDLQRVIWAFVLAVFWQGLDGMWQYYTGVDFIDKTPIMSGRLTGSLSTYRVGNYIALSLVPALALWLLLREKYSALVSGAASTVLLFPAFFLLFFSYTRSAYLALLTGVCLLLFLRLKKIRWRLILLPAGALSALSALALFMPQRFGPTAVAGDGRWDLWRFAWQVFLDNPWFGAGFGQYNPAFRALGYIPSLDEVTISHPHNIYLQMLCESGLVGTFCLVLFMIGFVCWGYRTIKAGLDRPEAADKARFYWQLAAFFWAAWGAFMANGIFGHDLFRLWWFSLSTMLLGCMIGACVNGPLPTSPADKDHQEPQHEPVRP